MMQSESSTSNSPVLWSIGTLDLRMDFSNIDRDVGVDRADLALPGGRATLRCRDGMRWSKIGKSEECCKHNLLCVKNVPENGTQWTNASRTYYNVCTICALVAQYVQTSLTLYLPPQIGDMT
jgi:hypothetical protein